MSSHSASDSGMQKMMLIVGIALCVLTVTIAITARTLSDGSNDEFDPLLHNAKMDRIQPVGQVRTEAPAATAVAAVAAGPARSGEELAGGMCASCHVSGAGGAPLFTDTAEWDKRSAAGLETLVASVVNGKGGMPARGASDYSDEEITRAVEFMTGLGNGGAVPSDDTSAATPAASDSEASASTTDATTEATTAAATESAEASATSATAASAEGVIAALTPRIKQTVDAGVCAGCHLSGVAGAPKSDDTAEWAKRAEQGYAALAQTVAKGKGAMPPRGGSDLTDDELLVAVEYMVLKSQ